MLPEILVCTFESRQSFLVLYPTETQKSWQAQYRQQVWNEIDVQLRPNELRDQTLLQ